MFDRVLKTPLLNTTLDNLYASPEPLFTLHKNEADSLGHWNKKWVYSTDSCTEKLPMNQPLPNIMMKSLFFLDRTMDIKNVK